MGNQVLKQNYGEWAVITGASDGIGKATAIELAKLGFSLILIARRNHLLKQLGEDLKEQYGIMYQTIVADLSKKDDVQKIIQQTSTSDIGLFVAAAGFGSSGLFVDSQIENELNMLEVNCSSVLSLSHHFGRLFKIKKRGGMIFYSSIVAFQGVPLSANYAASKAFIQSFAEGLHTEMKAYGVDVLVVAPGPVNTGFGQRAKLNIGNEAESPATIAQGSLNALGKKITVRPGFIAKLLGYSLSTAPRFLRIFIMGRIMSGMAKGQKS